MTPGVRQPAAARVATRPTVVSWDDAMEASRALAGRIADRGARYDTILAVARGGLVPAGILSYLLGVRDIATVSLDRYRGRAASRIRVVREPDWRGFAGRSVLVVDEILDEGATLRYIGERMSGAGASHATAVLYHKRRAPAPDYFARAAPADSWLEFPWGE